MSVGVSRGRGGSQPGVVTGLGPKAGSVMIMLTPQRDTKKVNAGPARRRRGGATAGRDGRWS